MIETNKADPKICVATLSVSLILNGEGKVTTRAQQWAQNPEAARLLIQSLNAVAVGIQKEIDTASPIVVVPAGGLDG